LNSLNPEQNPENTGILYSINRTKSKCRKSFLTRIKQTPVYSEHKSWT
jgi:hypothetical protein